LKTTRLLGCMSVIGAVLVALAPSAQANDGPYLSVMHEQYFAHVGGIPIPKRGGVGSSSSSSGRSGFCRTSSSLPRECRCSPLQRLPSVAPVDQGFHCGLRASSSRIRCSRTSGPIKPARSIVADSSAGTRRKMRPLRSTTHQSSPVGDGETDSSASSSGSKAYAGAEPTIVQRCSHKGTGAGA
jgi:hypothetical protein